jgi:hypothetical protein
MGVKTAAEIIKEGVELAGVAYDSTDNNPFSWLMQWLESVALGWPWPECMTSATYNLAAGQRGFTIGATSTNGTGLIVTRVNFPLEIMHGPDMLADKIYQEAFNAAYDTVDVPDNNPTRASYQRNYFKPGMVFIIFNAKPKTDIRIHVPYQIDPAYGLLIDNTPWYPNDETMICAVAYKAAIYADGVDAQTTAAFADKLSTMVRNDKLKFGVIDSFVMKMNRNPRSR